MRCHRPSSPFQSEPPKEPKIDILSCYQLSFETAPSVLIRYCRGGLGTWGLERARHPPAHAVLGASPNRIRRALSYLHLVVSGPARGFLFVGVSLLSALFSRGNAAGEREISKTLAFAKDSAERTATWNP